MSALGEYDDIFVKIRVLVILAKLEFVYSGRTSPLLPLIPVNYWAFVQSERELEMHRFTEYGSG
jgi:hypothetical protein